MKFNENHRIPRENYKNNKKNIWISCENNANHENPTANPEKHENLRILHDNRENHENLKIPREN